jgi:hypothetical protein
MIVGFSASGTFAMEFDLATGHEIPQSRVSYSAKRLVRRPPQYTS